MAATDSCRDGDRLLDQNPNVSVDYGNALANGNWKNSKYLLAYHICISRPKLTEDDIFQWHIYHVLDTYSQI